jgi:ubiquitin-activating enzyme E1 C
MAGLDRLLLRDTFFPGAGFEPGESLKSCLQDDLRILVVGAGGLGCELLKDLGAPYFCMLHWELIANWNSTFWHT